MEGMDNLASASAGIAQAAANIAAPAIEGKTAWKYTKKAMNLQNEFNIAAFNRSNERQDYLMENAQLIAKNALARAGYSTADPNGTGVSPANMQTQNTTSGPSVSVGMPNIDAISAYATVAQARKAEAEAKKVEAETDYQNMFNQLYSKYGEEQTKAALSNLQEDTKLKIAETLKTDQDKANSIQLTDAQVKDINDRLGMDWAKLEPQIQLLCAQAFEAEAAGHLNKAKISEVWQNIAESKQRIENLKKEYDLTDAQIAVAFASKQLIDQQKLSEIEETGRRGASKRSAEAQARIDELEAQTKENLGPGYYSTMKVIDDITSQAEKIGNTVSSFIPFTEKSDNTSDNVTTHYDSDGNLVSSTSSFRHDTHVGSRARGK